MPSYHNQKGTKPMAYVSANQRRKSQQRREKLLEILLAITTTFIFSILIMWVLINWISGCGETFPTASGQIIHGECILHPFKQ